MVSWQVYLTVWYRCRQYVLCFESDPIAHSSTTFDGWLTVAGSFAGMADLELRKSAGAQSTAAVGVLDAPCTARYSLATLRHSLGLSALMITEQAYAGTRRCGSAVDR